MKFECCCMITNFTGPRLTVLQQASVLLEPGTHVLSVALLDRSCLREGRGGCEIVELSVAFSVVEASFAWQEHDQPFVVTGRGAPERIVPIIARSRGAPALN
jgi:hypothetical protein